MTKIISRRARPHTITLYNYISTTNGIATYQRTVIQRVFLDTAYKQRLSQRGVSTEDTAQLIVELRDIETTSDRTFLVPWRWDQLTDAQKAIYFTFRKDHDFFIGGEISETLPPATKQDLIKKYDCLCVSSAAFPASGKEWPIIVEVTGK